VYTFMTLSHKCLHLNSSTRLVYVAGGVGVYIAGRVGVDEPLNPLAPGLVYVAGGMNKDSLPLAAEEAYNVEEDKWEILPPMIQRPGMRQCFHGR
jgi:hypothetical protein